MSHDRPVRWRMLAAHVPAGGSGGGIVRYVVELAAALHRRPDVELSVITSPAAQPFFAELLDGPARVLTLPPLPTTGQAVVERFTRRCEAGSPVDVLHGTKHLVPRRARALRLLTVHDMLPFDRPQDFGRAKRLLLRSPYRASIRDADVIACVSTATLRSMQKRVFGAASSAGVVPLAVSTSLRNATPRPVRLLNGRRFALVVGDASPRKNLPFVVGIWRNVVAAAPGAVLAIVGPPGWKTNQYGPDYDRLRGEGHIVELGHISDAELRWCYENARVTLCPSLLEGFGLPAVEALAFDSALITSLDPALCEVSGERATHLAEDDPGIWARTITAYLAAEPRAQRTPTVSRTWDDVAHDTLALVRKAMAGN